MTATPKAEPPRPFINVLADMPGLEGELSRKLNDVLQGVRETGKQGTLTLSLKLSPMKADAEIVEFQPTVTAKRPTLPVKGGMFFLDSDANPQRENPTARKLWESDEEVATVPDERAETVTVVEPDDAPMKIQD